MNGNGNGEGSVVSDFLVRAQAVVGAATGEAPVISAVFESNLLPPIPLDVRAGDGSPLSGLIALLQPRLRGTFAGIGDFTWAPAGDPQPLLGTVIFGAALLLMLYGAYKLVRR